MPEGYFVIFDLASLEAKMVEMEKNETGVVLGLKEKHSNCFSLDTFSIVYSTYCMLPPCLLNLHAEYSIYC